MDSDIEQYEREALVCLLGYPLYKLFFDELDSNEDNGLAPGADAKWNELLNGLEYTFDGKTVNWRGLRFNDETGILFNDAKRKQSLIAYYIYYFYIKKDIVTYTASGTHRINAANSESVNIIDKSVRAWQQFYNLSIGNYGEVRTSVNRFGMHSIDYYGSSNKDRSLYQFLSDQNQLVEDKYPDWEPTFFANQNRLGV